MKFPGLANVAGGIAFLFCFSVFSIQLFNLLKSWVSPTTTNTYVEEMPLENMNFPLDIILCVRPGMKIEALGDLGYSDATSFSMGASMFNQSLVGWGGHDDKGKGLKSAKEVINLVKYDWSKELPVYNVTNHFQSTYILKLNMINWLEDCHTLNLSDIEYHVADDDEHKEKHIYIFFNETVSKNNITFELQLQDKGLAAHRRIEEHKFFYNGDAMKSQNSMTSHIVKIKKNVFVEEDPRKSCRNYPNAEFSSYAECDDQYMRERIDKAAPGLNLTPPWLTMDLDKVTMAPVVVPIKVIGNVLKLGSDG